MFCELCRGHLLKAAQSMACRDPCKVPLLAAVPHVLEVLDKPYVSFTGSHLSSRVGEDLLFSSRSFACRVNPACIWGSLPQASTVLPRAGCIFMLVCVCLCMFVAQLHQCGVRLPCTGLLREPSNAKGECAIPGGNPAHRHAGDHCLCGDRYGALQLVSLPDVAAWKTHCLHAVCVAPST
jgi:hypothetical protein